MAEYISFGVAVSDQRRRAFRGVSMRHSNEHNEMMPRSRIALQQSVGILMMRAARMKCPACGDAEVFQGWFAMNDRCPQCGRLFNRAPGYFLGSIYFNYGVTAILLVMGYFGLYFAGVHIGKGILAGLATFSALFPLWFFRYARTFWLALDEYWDPWPNEQEAQEESKRLAATGREADGAP